MSDLWEPSGNRARTVAGLVAVALIVASLLVGCGGGSSSSTPSGPAADAAGGAAAQTNEGGPSQTTAEPAGPDSEAPRTKATHHAKHAEDARQDHRRKQHTAEGTGPGRAAAEGTGSGGQGRTTGAPDRPTKATTAGAEESSSVREGKAPESSLGGASPVAVRKLRKHCPKNIDATSCTRLVEAYVAAQGTESQPVATPQDCTATRTEAECEVILREQAEAAEQGESLNVQECIAHMTPQCEAVLRLLFESQQAAQAGGG